MLHLLRWDGPAALSGLSAGLWLGGAKLKEHVMRTSQKTPESISTIGIDVGKNTFHLVGLDKRGAIVLQPYAAQA